LIHTVTDANNKVTTYAYDARGNRTSVIDPVNGSGNPTTFTYDSMNRLTSITYPTATTSVQFHYDYRGRRDWVQDQNGNKTTYAYDDADRLISVTDPQSGVTTYAYDTENNLTDIHDALGNHTHMDYNGNAVWLSAITFPSGYVEHYTWDTAFHIIRSKQDRNGNTINYNYDFQNRLWQKNYPNSTTTQFDYDAADRLSQVTDPTGTYTFTYDNMNRLIQASTDYSFDTAGAMSVGYGYDAASNRTSMTDPQSLSTAYTYDVLNRLSTLAFNGQTPAFGFGYDDLSRRTSLTRPNGVNTSYNYDPMSRLLSVLHKVGSTTLDGASYTYDDAGNRTSKTDLRTNVTSAYGYDALYQLTGVSQGATTTESYTYDAVGNRLSSLGVSPYQYNSSNQLTSLPNVGYTYDNNGNTKTKTDTSGITTYNWDYENRLSGVVLPGSGGTVSFKYDPFGRRIQKAAPGGTVNYLYDGVNLLEEVDNGGNVLARYTQDRGLDALLSELRGSTTSYYQADEALGSITSLSNSSGALTNTYTYDSFGNLTASTGSLTNPFRYTGRELDSETGLYFYRARYLDSSTGRFISEDPIRFEGGDDFYAYVDNSPINEFDPLGLSGGPKKPRGKMRCRDGGFDSCKALQWKIALFEKAIYSHAGFDWYMPWPRGGGRHDDEIAELFNGLANCIKIYEKRCKKNQKQCDKDIGLPDPQPKPTPQPTPPTPFMSVPIDPIIPPMPMPDPIIFPEPIFAPI
jgi:RHS repeat-associated protein